MTKGPFKVTVKESVDKEIVVHEHDMVGQGQWVENNTVISRMWKHVPSGEIFYEDVPKVRARGLLVNPFL